MLKVTHVVSATAVLTVPAIWPHLPKIPFFYAITLYLSHLVNMQTYKTIQNSKKCLWIDFLCFSAVLKSSWSSWKSDEWDDSYCFVLPGLLLHQKATDWEQRTFRKDNWAFFAKKLSYTNQIKFIWNYVDSWMQLQWFLTKPNEQNFNLSMVLLMFQMSHILQTLDTKNCIFLHVCELYSV